jgi:hypothetical protein
LKHSYLWANILKTNRLIFPPKSAIQLTRKKLNEGDYGDYGHSEGNNNLDILLHIKQKFVRNQFHPYHITTNAFFCGETL